MEKMPGKVSQSHRRPPPPDPDSLPAPPRPAGLPDNLVCTQSIKTPVYPPASGRCRIRWYTAFSPSGISRIHLQEQVIARISRMSKT